MGPRSYGTNKRLSELRDYLRWMVLEQTNMLSPLHTMLLISIPQETRPAPAELNMWYHTSELWIQNKDQRGD